MHESVNKMLRNKLKNPNKNQFVTPMLGTMTEWNQLLTSAFRNKIWILGQWKVCLAQKCTSVIMVFKQINDPTHPSNPICYQKMFESSLPLKNGIDSSCGAKDIEPFVMWSNSVWSPHFKIVIFTSKLRESYFLRPTHQMHIYVYNL